MFATARLPDSGRTGRNLGFERDAHGAFEWQMFIAIQQSAIGISAFVTLQNTLDSSLYDNLPSLQSEQTPE